ncbi:MAG TPA: carboxypeptidase regulatory-like domain-containing protein [Blastocatellia bacterium]|nr:carboxypeptidase regulatory-like domain-containing protein [Blastocatellia bacterium]
MNSYAQVTTGSFSGFVTDSSGAAIGGARVTATNEATGLTRTVTTSSSGEYVLARLPVGRYTLTFEAPNFRQRLIKGAVLELDQRARIDSVMEVGPVSEIITVDGAKSAPLARTETAEAGEVIENKRIVELPLNGRLFLQLAQLTPGVVENARGGFGQQLAGVSGPRITVMGARESDNYFTLDGVSVTDRFYNTLSTPMAVDAIQEFKVQSNLYSAEAGTLGGAQINIAIKSGTNDLHGSAYGFLRNDNLDARNFFDRQLTLESPAKPEFRQNQFGGTVGGPLIKNRGFFFGNYEGLRLAKALTRRFTVPTDNLRNGQFSTPIRDPQLATPTMRCEPTPVNPEPGVNYQGACFPGNRIPDNRIPEIVRGLLQYIPQANLPGTSNNLIGSPQEINDSNQFTIRTDYRFSDRDTAFVRYTFYDVNAYQPYGFVQFAASPISLPGFGIFLKQRTQNVAVGETHVFNSNLVGEFKFGFNRTAGGQLQENNDVDFVSRYNIAGISRNPLDRGIPSIVVSPYNTFGDATTPISRRDNDSQFNYNLSWVRGSHNLTFGAMYKRIQFNPNVSFTKRGQFTFTGAYTNDAFGDLLLGLPFNARGGAGSTLVYLRGNEWHAFLQHDWKAAKRLTLNAGLRYEYASPFSEKYNRWSTLNVETGRVIVASEDGRTYPRELWIPGIERRLSPLPIVTSEAAGLDRSLATKDLNNFAPRFGFAFDLFGNQRTVMRGGYGIFFNSASFNTATLQSLAAPFFSSINANNSTTAPAAITAILSNSVLGTPGWSTYDINFRTPYFQQWNFGLQQLLARDLLVEAQYLGSKGTKLYTNIYFNVPDPAVPSPTTPSIAARSRFPSLGNNALQASAGKSNYHALVLRTEKRLSRGLMVMGSYTFSKSIDLDSLGASVTSSNLDQSNQKKLERARSSFDARHRFVASFTYDLPFKSENKAINSILGNWQAGGIITQQSGLPFTVNITSDRANNGLLNQRPNLVGDPNLPGSQRTPERWFNTGAFAVQPAGTLGTAGRNILEGPGTNIVDFSLIKNIPLGERHKFQFRAEVFNIFNHANFDFPERLCAGTVPGTACTASQFGRIGAARDPRILQFALKYLF